jgi:hypothetical protein
MEADTLLEVDVKALLGGVYSIPTSLVGIVFACATSFGVPSFLLNKPPPESGSVKFGTNDLRDELAAFFAFNSTSGSRVGKFSTSSVAKVSSAPVISSISCSGGEDLKDIFLVGDED